MAEDVGAIAGSTTEKVRLILGHRPRVGDMEIWAPRIASALIATALAALSHRRPMTTVEAVELGLMALAREPGPWTASAA